MWTISPNDPSVLSDLNDTKVVGVLSLRAGGSWSAGGRVLEAIKADPRLRILPVTRLTTSDREEDVVRSYNDGASSYIRKPMTVGRFAQVVKEFELY